MGFVSMPGRQNHMQRVQGGVVVDDKRGKKPFAIISRSSSHKPTEPATVMHLSTLTPHSVLATFKLQSVKFQNSPLQVDEKKG